MGYINYNEGETLPYVIRQRRYSRIPGDMQRDYFDAIALLESGKSLEMPLSRNLFSICIGLHELRLKDASGHVRFFYYIKKKAGIYILHAFKKKKEELPKNEIKLALKRIKEV